MEDEEHARAVANRFSIPTSVVVLDSVFDALLEVLPGDKVNPGISQLAEGNLKARLRMLTLYYMANRLKYVVAGASNRSELTLGYFTKYGDGGADILPLGNLVKGRVRELASVIGVPQEIIDKPPSARLWPGQTDESELGFTYEELDHYLITGKASSDLRQKVESKITMAKHKCCLPPVANF
jgi:NAD+ synthase